MARQPDAGTRFPFISLEKAISRASELYEADHKGRPLAIGTAFAAWKYTDKSSGGHQTVGALKGYGLISDSGANADRRINLTQEALHYFADEREDERKKLLRHFALSPRLIAAVWESWGATPPPDTIARSQLKIDRKLNDQSARSFLSIYRANMTFAAMATAGKIIAPNPVEIADEPDEVDRYEPPFVGDLVQWSPSGIDQFNPPARVRAVAPEGDWIFVDGSETGIPVNETVILKRAESARAAPPFLPLPAASIPAPPAGIKRDVFSLEEGEVTITFPASLTAESYKDLVDWLDLVKRKAERAVKADGKTSQTPN